MTISTSLQSLPIWLDVVLALAVIFGTGFALVGSWGLAKLDTFQKRLHGPTKATTLGVGCILLASSAWFTFIDQNLSWHEWLIAIFLFITAPVSAHLLIQAGLKIGVDDKPPPLPK